MRKKDWRACASVVAWVSRWRANAERSIKKGETEMTARTAVVTGGTGGLGETISTKLHDKGYTVVVTHSPGNKRIKELLTDYGSKGYHFHAYEVDVADFDSCQACVSKIQSEV